MSLHHSDSAAIIIILIVSTDNLSMKRVPNHTILLNRAKLRGPLKIAYPKTKDPLLMHQACINLMSITVYMITFHVWLDIEVILNKWLAT